MSDVAAVFAELDNYFRQEQRQPGDLTIADLTAHYKITRHTAENRMRELVEEHPDEWKMLMVFEKGKEKWVLRKVSE